MKPFEVTYSFYNNQPTNHRPPENGVKTMRIVNYKSNQTIVHADTYSALLSYGVPQVVVCNPDNHLLGKTVLVNNKRYSNTTSKHRNAYLRKLNLDNTVVIEATPAEIQEVTGLETR